MSNVRRGLTKARLLGLVFVVFAAALLVASLKLPLWQMRMEAPQYRDEEALCVRVFPNAMQGDLKELAVLNQYIGVRVPEVLPQFNWLPLVLVAGAALGVLAAGLPRSARSLAGLAITTGVALALLIAAVQARSQMHDIGHHRDPHAAMTGFRDFTPPLIGAAKIAQFEVTSTFGSGAWLIGIGLTLQLAAAWISRGKTRHEKRFEHSVLRESLPPNAVPSTRS